MAADTTWTEATIEAELRLAMWTLQRLPSKNLVPAGFKVAWPDVVLSREEAYGYHAAMKPRMQATAAQIQAMDVALGWCWQWLAPAPARAAGLVEDVGNIVLMRSAGLSWERVGEWRLARWCAPRAARGVIPGGNSVRQNRAHYRAGIARIAQQIGTVDQMPEDPAPVRLEERVVVEVARQGETLGEGSKGRPIYARARWAVVPKGRRGG